MKKVNAAVCGVLAAGLFVGCLPGGTTAGAKQEETKAEIHETVTVPVLMYHNFAAEDGSYTVSARRFREHLSALTEAGYESVSFGELAAFADGTGELPDKPVVLVSDDGYTGVLEFALPVLAELDMTMSVAVIGNLLGVGGEGRLPHFSLDELEAADSDGRLEVISHSFALHGTNSGMEGAVNLDLPAAEYEETVLSDCAVMQALENVYPGLGQVFVYPFGAWSADSEALLARAGYKITVTTAYGTAQVTRGEPLTLLPRIPAEWYKTGEALVEVLHGAG